MTPSARGEAQNPMQSQLNKRTDPIGEPQIYSFFLTSSDKSYKAGIFLTSPFLKVNCHVISSCYFHCNLFSLWNMGVVISIAASWFQYLMGKLCSDQVHVQFSPQALLVCGPKVKAPNKDPTAARLPRLQGFTLGWGWWRWDAYYLDTQ